MDTESQGEQRTTKGLGGREGDVSNIKRFKKHSDLTHTGLETAFRCVPHYTGLFQEGCSPLSSPSLHAFLHAMNFIESTGCA